MMSRRLSLIVVVFVQLLCTMNSIAQTRAIDSLSSVIEKSSGVTKYEAQISFVRKIVAFDYLKGLEVSNLAHQYALEIGDSARIVQSGRIMGQFNNYLQNSINAITILEMVRPIAERHNYTEDLIKIYDNLGIAYTAQAKYDIALKLHFKALALSEQVADRVAKAATLTNIGGLYVRMSNNEEALKHYLLSERIKLEEKDYYHIERLYSGIGSAYYGMREFEKADEYFQKALDACNGNCNSDMMIHINLTYAFSRFEQKDYDQARHFVLKVIELAEHGNFTRSLVDGLFTLGKIELAVNNLDQSRMALRRAAEIGLREKMRNVVVLCYRDLAAGYDREKDFTNSAVYLKKYIALKDSIYNSGVMENLAQAKSDYEQRENLAIIKARELTIEQQRKFNYAIIVIAVMAVAFGVFLFRNNRLMTEMNKKLTAAQDMIFEQNKKLELRNRELDSMVEKKTEELKLVNLSLRQMNNELDRFINKTAEDIRAPLASLKGICNVALKDIQDQAPLVYLNKINSTTELLNSILKRLLAINKINQSRVSVSEIDLKALVDNILAGQQKKGLPANLIIRKHIEANVIINSDRELLSVVLENSIDNAVKFCKNSPRAEHFVEIRVAPTRNGRISFSIIDNGISSDNFDPEEVDEIFMQSVDDLTATAERKDLYFVKTAAEKIGGRVQMNKTQEGFNELCVII
jgi:signal transduction histidine kinase